MPLKKPCINRDCYKISVEKGRCLEHFKEIDSDWSHSTRSKRLPKDWSTRRKHIMKRDNGTCYKCGDKADQVDHIEPGDDHSFDNLAAICETCHRKKTAQEWGVLPEHITLLGQQQYKEYMRKKSTPYLPSIDPNWEYKMNQ